ncbi:hypothetical protein ACN42_g3057 [Penicillium freii]|uniref:Uncharacterized protein n=1 Tax=Penicillium freii TaxID=48697 RepID=A0A101MNX8_PENFR|nr:hypothetical protein ACN42_g3057 [Penicillium freii]
MGEWYFFLFPIPSYIMGMSLCNLDMTIPIHSQLNHYVRWRSTISRYRTFTIYGEDVKADFSSVWSSSVLRTRISLCWQVDSHSHGKY